jgi:hypothetical protein
MWEPNPVPENDAASDRSADIPNDHAYFVAPGGFDMSSSMAQHAQHRGNADSSITLPWENPILGPVARRPISHPLVNAISIEPAKSHVTGEDSACLGVAGQGSQRKRKLALASACGSMEVQGSVAITQANTAAKKMKVPKTLHRASSEPSKEPSAGFNMDSGPDFAPSPRMDASGTMPHEHDKTQHQFLPQMQGHARQVHSGAYTSFKTRQTTDSISIVDMNMPICGDGVSIHMGAPSNTHIVTPSNTSMDSAQSTVLLFERLMSFPLESVRMMPPPATASQYPNIDPAMFEETDTMPTSIPLTNSHVAMTLPSNYGIAVPGQPAYLNRDITENQDADHDQHSAGYTVSVEHLRFEPSAPRATQYQPLEQGSSPQLEFSELEMKAWRKLKQEVGFDDLKKQYGDRCDLQ